MNAAETMGYEERPCHIYHLGDWDPSGQDAARHIEQSLRELAPDVDLYFERIAVTEDQISDLDLPSRPTKSSDSRSVKWRGGESVELDAIHPDKLRQIVKRVIHRYLPPKKLKILKIAEKSERQSLVQLAANADLTDDDDYDDEDE